MRYGIDVSHHQGSIDWSKVKTTGKVTFAIMKAMYESDKSKDECFDNNYAGCTNNGINRGVYNFIGSVSASDPIADANALLKIINGRQLECGIWLDVESDKLAALGSNVIEDVILKEYDILSKAGYNVGIYCNLNWYKNIITSTLKKKFNGRFWIARYPKNDKGEPVNNLSPKNTCPESVGWQYSAKGSVDGINGNVDMDMFWGDMVAEKITGTVFSRQSIVAQCERWLNEAQYSDVHLEILNVYNNHTPLPRGYAVKPNDSWCATFASAVFIQCGYDYIFPIECSCGRMIEKAKEMGIWVENDNFVPKPGDLILYDWQDTGSGDNLGYPEHVGIVTYVNEESGYMVVTEGNNSNTVKNRNVNINGLYIRGFITPDFNIDGISENVSDTDVKKDVETIANEVIAGMWGNYPEREKLLTDAGYNYQEVRAKVNEILNNQMPAVIVDNKPVSKITCTAKAQKINKAYAGEYFTTANLYCRDGAGTNKKALCCIPINKKVQCYGYYSVANGVDWLCITFELDGIQYTGFSSSIFLRR